MNMTVKVRIFGLLFLFICMSLSSIQADETKPEPGAPALATPSQVPVPNPGPVAAPGTDQAPQTAPAPAQVNPSGSPTATPPSEWRPGIHIGISPNMGFIGAEFQKGQYAFTLGFPGNIGVKYYMNEKGIRLFYLAHAMYGSGNDDDTVDDVEYDSYREFDAGVGLGYKWRWRNHWDVTLSISADYYRDKHSGPSGSCTETGLMPFPGLMVGYTF